MSKGLPELSEEKYKSEGLGTDEKKFENVRKDLGHKGKSKASAHQNQDCQRNLIDDPPDLKGEATDSVPDLSSTTVRNIISLAATLARRDDAPQIIQSLGLSKIKCDILKSIVDRFRTKGHNINDSAFYRTANSGAVQASRSATYANRRYDDNFAILHDAFTNLHNNTASGALLGDYLQLHRTSKESNQQADDYLHEFLLVAMGDDGGGDPEQTKLINVMPLGKSGLPVSLARYLIELKAREIHTEILQKECNTVDFSKITKSSLSKLSWKEKCEEVHIHTVLLPCYFIFNNTLEPG